MVLETKTGDYYRWTNNYDNHTITTNNNHDKYAEHVDCNFIEYNINYNNHNHNIIINSEHKYAPSTLILVTHLTFILHLNA